LRNCQASQPLATIEIRLGIPWYKKQVLKSANPGCSAPRVGVLAGKVHLPRL